MTAVDVIRIIRDAAAHRAAKYAYQRSADAHRARETALLMCGFEQPASVHMEAERLLLRAYQAEMDDPEPKA